MRLKKAWRVRVTLSPISFVVLATCLAGTSAAAQTKAPDVTGVWAVDLDPDFGGHQGTIGCTFKQDGQSVRGACGHDAPEPQAPITGRVHDDTLTFELKTGRQNEQTATFTATLADQASTMKGEWRFVDDQGKDHRGKFSGRRAR
jgi:hypothetical protein